jgi:hypothetical protein
VGFPQYGFKHQAPAQFGPESFRSCGQVKSGPDIPCRMNQFAQAFEITSAKRHFRHDVRNLGVQ